MAWYGARSFGTVETIMNQSNPAFVVQTKPLVPAVIRAVLRYAVAEQNRWLFRQWENLQIGMAALFFGYLLFGTMEGKFSLSVMLAMLVLTMVQRLLISPELGLTGSALRGFAGVPVGGRQPQAGERGVAGWRIGRDPFQRLLRLDLLVLRGLAGSSGEADAGGLGGRDAAVLVVLEAADAGDDEHGRCDDEGAVLLPQLEELLAPQLLVDFPGQAVSLVHDARPASAPRSVDVLGAT